MPYIGNQPAEQFTSFATQTFSVSATTSYTLDHAVTNENEIALFVNNVRQQPGSGKAYTATGTALTLSAATASTDTMYCVFLGRALQTVNPATNSIDNTMISSTAAIATTKLGAGAILQVLQDTTSTEVTTSSTSFVAGGLSQAITPSSSSNKILIICSYTMSQINSGKNSVCSVFRDSTNLDGGDLGLGRLRADAANLYSRQTISLLDSPSSTSAITYSLKLKCYSSSADARLHQNSNIGSLILMEIAG